MSVTTDTFQDETLPLKVDASKKVFCNVVTWATSHNERSALNARDSLNDPTMLITLATFQAEISPLKDLA
jgi:hypothetical protein